MKHKGVLTLKHQVILREFQPQDTDALADIIRITWGYDKFGSHETACKLARAYLDLCLTNQTYTKLQLWMVFRLALLWAKISESINVLHT